MVLPLESLAVTVMLKAVPAVCGLLMVLNTNLDRLLAALTCILETAKIVNAIRNAAIRICVLFMIISFKYFLLS